MWHTLNSSHGVHVARHHRRVARRHVWHTLIPRHTRILRHHRRVAWRSRLSKSRPHRCKRPPLSHLVPTRGSSGLSDNHEATTSQDRAQTLDNNLRNRNVAQVCGRYACKPFDDRVCARECKNDRVRASYSMTVCVQTIQ